MHGKWFAAGALATAGMLALALPARAGDTYRLSIPGRTADAPTLGLVDDGKGADTVSIRGGHGGHGGGHGGGGHGGGHGGFHGFRDFDRGFHGSRDFDRGFHGFRDFDRGFHGFRGYYGGFGFYPSYYSSYYQPYYYSTPSLYYSAPAYSVDPCLYSSVGVSTPALGLSVNVAPTTRRRIVELVAAPAAVQIDDQTFPYDGGPRIPAPMPNADPTPGAPLPLGPVDEHPISLPAKVVSRLVYPAYGEQTTLPTAPRVSDRGVLVKGDPARKLTK
jgi:hypothetical protein